jgi:serine/threonine protein kinase
MKVIKKDKLRVNFTSQKESTLCVNELKALKNLHHPNIVQIKEVINDTKEKNLYLIM